MNESINKYNQLTTNMFWLAFGTIFIFGIPASIAVYIGLRLDAWQGTGRLWTVVLLLPAFISSWVILLVRYRSLREKLRELKKQ